MNFLKIFPSKNRVRFFSANFGIYFALHSIYILLRIILNTIQRKVKLFPKEEQKIPEILSCDFMKQIFCFADVKKYFAKIRWEPEK